MAPNPIGYWVSAREEHPAYPMLNHLEEKFGSYFQALTREELLCILAFCTIKTAGETWCVTPGRTLTSKENEALDLIEQLPQDFQLGLVPFVYEQLHRYSREQIVNPKFLSRKWHKVLTSQDRITYCQAYLLAEALAKRDLGLPLCPRDENLIAENKHIWSILTP